MAIGVLVLGILRSRKQVFTGKRNILFICLYSFYNLFLSFSELPAWLLQIVNSPLCRQGIIADIVDANYQ